MANEQTSVTRVADRRELHCCSTRHGDQGRMRDYQMPKLDEAAGWVFWRELADHRVADRHYEQLTDALQHVAGE